MKKKQSPQKWIISTIGNAKYGVLLLSFFQAIHSLCTILFALLLRNTIDAASSRDSGLFINCFIILVSIIIIQLALRAGIRYWEERVKSSGENVLKLHVYRIILTRSYASLGKYHTGELLNRMTGDTAVIAEGLSSILPNTIAMGIKLLGSCCVLIWLDPRFGIVFLLGGGLLLGTTWLFRKVLKMMHKQVQEADDSVRSYLQESVENLLILRSFGIENKVIVEGQNRMAVHKEKRLKRNLFSNLCNIGFGVAMRSGYLFGLLWCGLNILNGRVSFGTLAAVLQLVNQIQSPLANLTSFLPKHYAMLSSAERIMELEALPVDAVCESLPHKQIISTYQNLSNLRGDRLSFAYEGNPEILTDASFSIPKGAFVAIMGQSGSGKSTLLKLLLAVYQPTAGALTLVENDGKEIAITPNLRKLFAYVPQGSFLMSGTIAQTISCMEDRDVDWERLKTACQIACAEFIFDLPEGLNTRIGERGTGLSEGQIQRLAVARAIYSEAPILLLDESTSALDETTEHRLLQNIQELTDKTVIIVTHRKTALEVCSQIFLAENNHFREVSP
ncbi:MAG: ABC transporter ATP-binding protein [Phocaeicola sp.]